MSLDQRTHYDGKAFASCILAVAAALSVGIWLLATALACASIACAVASRRATRADDSLRGSGVALAGFLVAGGVLLFGTVGPSLLTMFLFAIAPPPAI